MTALVWLGVAVAGGLGAVLRFLVDRLVARHTPNLFPYGTLAVNISGAAVLGFLSALAWSSQAELLAGTAVVGSYTTFSTWMFETQRLGEERQISGAISNLVISLVVGVSAAAVGRLVGTAL